MVVAVTMDRLISFLVLVLGVLLSQSRGEFMCVCFSDHRLHWGSNTSDYKIQGS
jgi:hypothetical protein